MFGANALTLYLAFLVFAVGGRIVLHYLATGDHGVRTVKRTASNTAKCASVLLFTSFVATFVLSFLDATGAVRPQADLGGSANMLGAAISLAGIALMIVSQYQMGAAWRFGVDPAEKTDLVTKRPLRSRQEPDLQRRVPFLHRLAGVAPAHIDADFSRHGLVEHRVAGALRRRAASSSCTAQIMRNTPDGQAAIFRGAAANRGDRGFFNNPGERAFTGVSNFPEEGLSLPKTVYAFSGSSFRRMPESRADVNTESQDNEKNR